MRIDLIRVGALAALLVALVGTLTPALARQSPRGGAQDEFVPMSDLPRQEQLPAAPLLMTAYAVVWAVLLVYVWSLWRRIGAVARDVDELARRLREGGRHS